MGGVYCPTCEASVEVTAKFCLSCGHDLTTQGPITATGHDLNQLKERDSAPRGSLDGGEV